MATEEYSVGYDEGYQAGWNAALKPAPPSRQEPPAPIHQVSMRTGSTNTAWIDCDDGTYNSASLLPNEYNVRKLYTAPPSKPEQGCCECGKKASDGWALYCVKCTETWDTSDMAYRPGGLSMDQEPVAWMQADQAEVYVKEFKDEVRGYTIPLYTAPPISDYHEGWEEGFKAAKKDWVSLTDEEIENFDLPDKPTVKEFVRFIEAALRSKNHG